MTALVFAAQEQARQKRKEAVAAVRSCRYTRLMLSLSCWLQGNRWRADTDAQTLKRLRSPLKKFADQELAHDQKRLHKRGKNLPAADAESRHRVRIAAKRTRYATEFFQSLYPAKRVRPYVSVLSELQDELGWLNGAAVAEKLLREFQRPEIADTGLAGEAGFVRGYLALTSELARPKLQKMWKRFVPLRVPC